MIDFTLKRTLIQNSRLSSVDFSNLPFGKIFSDHMFTVNYANGAWQPAEIRPFGNLSLSPATASLHYGQAIFEGMKAEKDPDGNVLLFRPQDNIRRLNRSAKRLCMPELPEELFMEGLKELLALDKDWIPTQEGYSLYIRPFMFSTDPAVGVRPSETYEFIIFTCPVGPYYSGDVNVYMETHYSRACQGGVGEAKAAGNYAASLYPAKLAKEKGYDQILWTDAKEHRFIQEIGTMNVFFIIDGTAITPELDGNILKGITRDSIIKLLRDEGIKVEERPVSVHEIIDAHDNGLLQDCFGAGTAATITFIASLGYEGHLMQLPEASTRRISQRIKQRFINIKKGLEPDKFDWIVKL
ncbi:MAG: branched-chain amino acid aminotransferase [Chitinophagales bacterium]|nr:branched-chain amino acid aminotransferase [Bacteroidota bacterium]MCB9043081.1 branched-chain amino acid aminotransferase [Chitinophagales bacterium]